MELVVTFSAGNNTEPEQQSASLIEKTCNTRTKAVSNAGQERNCETIQDEVCDNVNVSS